MHLWWGGVTSDLTLDIDVFVQCHGVKCGHRIKCSCHLVMPDAVFWDRVIKSVLCMAEATSKILRSVAAVCSIFEP